MAVETLGEALREGWRIRLRCAQGGRAGMKSIRECTASVEADLATLVWTRGRALPLSELTGKRRLRCPRCGSYRVAVIFEPPAVPVRIGERRKAG